MKSKILKKNETDKNGQVKNMATKSDVLILSIDYCSSKYLLLIFVLSNLKNII